ncbi:phage tail protein [Peptostreptococcus sp. D1]|uniref:phage tail protein n=1 Tax=Peptostreptococcus sp. D1 TaxID=72304 RepID=UPI0008F40CE2|nr:phage tail protein [Peptostreptococcus sp. D1]SFE83915.1 Prophage endopeptidase tail [Peptostreptococcus sp. D1]
MYKIYCDNELIFDLSGDTTLVSPVLKLQDNNAGTIEFSILPDHFIYNKIRKMKSEIKVTSGEKTIFASRPIDETIDFKNCKKVMCEGALAYLNDSIQRPAEYHNLTIRSYLETLINYHNQQVSDPRLQFKIGMVTVHDDNDSIYKYTNWETTLQVIKTDLVDKYGGHLRVRFEGDTKYLDYLKDYPRTNKQVIEFGTNLLDFTKNIDATQIVTAVIPLGARLEESSIKKLEERLTIKSVNNNLDYVASKSAVDTYGWIFKTVTWDNVHKPIILKNKGEEYLKSIQFENVILKVKAIDLHMVNVDIEQIELLDEVRVISKPNGLDKVFPVSELVIDMMNPQANTITLGQNGIQAMSGSAVSSNNEIMKKIDSIPPVDDAINEAVKNATEMINNALNGHVVKRKDELLIMDTADMKTAKKVWRWNLNGLAYSNNGYIGPYETAITMDGSIVANRITTGILKGGFVKFDLTRGTFLIGRNDQDFLLKFDGEKLQFGNGTLSKDALEKELLDALKGKDGKDGKSFRYNLISCSDFSSKKCVSNKDFSTEKKYNVWVPDSGDASNVVIDEKSKTLTLNGRPELNQHIMLESNKKYYLKIRAKGKFTIYRMDYETENSFSSYKNLISFDDDDFKTKIFSFTTTSNVDHYSFQIDCNNPKSAVIDHIIISDTQLTEYDEWFPSREDLIGAAGKDGKDGKSFVPNLIEYGDFTRQEGFNKQHNGRFTDTEEPIYNTWLIEDVSKSKVVGTDEKYFEITAFGTPAKYITKKINKQKKYYFKFTAKGHCDVFVYLKHPNAVSTTIPLKMTNKLDAKSDDWKTFKGDFTVTYTPDYTSISLFNYSDSIPFCIKNLIISEEPISDDTDWVPATGKDMLGPKGDRGAPGKDGTLAELPESLKQWSNNATEISGKYVYTPELFVGESSVTSSSKTGVYVGKNVRVNFNGYWTNLSGLIGLNEGKVYWMFTTDGRFVLGHKFGERIELGADGRAIIPTIKSNMIETGAINTDILTPGTNERIVLERGYTAGSNNCKQIDTNYDGVRLKADADTYINVRKSNRIDFYTDGFAAAIYKDSWYETHPAGSTSNSGTYRLEASNALITAGWVKTVAMSPLSDISLKENVKYLDSDFVFRENKKHEIEHLNVDDIMNFVKNARIATYDYKDFGIDSISVVAQNLLKFEKVEKYLVNKYGGKYGVNIYSYMSMLHVALQEEIKRNDNIESEINLLKDENVKLNKKIDDLEKKLSKALKLLEK